MGGSTIGNRCRLLRSLDEDLSGDFMPLCAEGNGAPVREIPNDGKPFSKSRGVELDP